LLADLRYSARGLARTPGLTAVLLLTIAIGVGGNAMIYGFIRGSLNHTSALPNPRALVSIVQHDPAGGFLPMSAAELDAIITRAPAFEHAGAFREDHDDVTFNGVSTSALVGAQTPGLLPALGFARLRAASGEAVVSHHVWADVFGAPKQFAGETLTVNGRAFTIAGVAPDTFDGVYAGRPVDVWVPIDTLSLSPSEREGRVFWTIARLRPGVTLAQAQRDVMSALGGQSRAVVVAYTGVEPQVAGALSRITVALPIAALIVFLIACANLATFLLSRAVNRSHETSVRVAIGATRRRIARQLLTDSLLVALTGAAAGATLSLWASRLVPALFFSQDAEQLSFAPGAAAVLLSCVACVAITALCGLVPLSEVRDADPASVLRRESGGLSNRARRARVVLVIGQMSACCVLLISAGVLMSGFRAALKTTLGSRLGEPVIATVTWGAGFGGEGGDGFYDMVRKAVAGTPGVTSAEWTSALPGAQPSWQPVAVEPATETTVDVSLHAEAFPPEPPAKLLITPRAGRMFGGRDGRGACPSVMLNDAAAALVDPDGDPVGRLIEDSTGNALEIIGVVSVAPKEGPQRWTAPTAFYYREQRDPPVPPGSTAIFRVPSWTATPARGSLDSSFVAPGYLDFVGAKITSGSGLSPSLTGIGCRVAVVNSEAEQRFFGGHAAGRAFLTPSKQRVLVTGVVRTFPLRVAQPVTEPAVFYPMAQNFAPRMTLLIGTSGPVSKVVDELRRRLNGIPDQKVPPRVVTLDEHLSMTALAASRITSTLFAVCALLAVVLSTMGVYGAMSDAVHQRRRELALRAALGAQGWRLMRLVLWEGVRLTLIGAAIGATIAGALERWAIQPEPGAVVWPAWAAAPILLALVVLMSAVAPARRAATADPLMLMKDV
jgi:predicted permease